MKDRVYDAMSAICEAIGHRGACWVFNGAIGQRIVRWIFAEDLRATPLPDVKR